MNMTVRRSAAACLLVAGIAALSGCKHGGGDIVVDEGVGITAVRSHCPSVGIPDYTGDITLFRTAGSTNADDLDVTAAMTDLRSACNDQDQSAEVRATLSFTVLARRNDTHGARQVTLPWFITVLRGGTAVITKRIGSVTINFADGQDRAQAQGQGFALIDRTAATLPKDVRDRITRKRKAGDNDAALDPLADPQVKSAVASATFEVLAGFQLDEKQIAYNATR
jgi:hypothetical protein